MIERMPPDPRQSFEERVQQLITDKQQLMEWLDRYDDAITAAGFTMVHLGEGELKLVPKMMVPHDYIEAKQQRQVGTVSGENN